MKVRLLAVVLTAALAGAIAGSDDTGPRPTDLGRPVAGVVALVDADAPPLDLYHGHICGAVATSARLVLTAAHCVHDRRASDLHVVVGADNLCRTAAVEGVRIQVRRIVTHPQYSQHSARYDLARLELAGSVAGPSIRSTGSSTGDGFATVLGWGSRTIGGARPCNLRSGRLRLHGNADCATLVASGQRAFDPASMLCATAVTPADDPCTGDSGGPLVAGTDVDGGVVIGIVSWGYGCGDGRAGVYARADNWP